VADSVHAHDCGDRRSLDRAHLLRDAAAMYLARVYVTLKPTVNDPQGLTIRGGLHSLGFDRVRSARAGKYMEIMLDVPDRAAAESQVAEMCRKLLANPVIEEFRFELEETVVTA
jgi:phosphoribosylformylglycinamidine synthase subunit PurS